jgi:hypothetical protein
MRPIPPHVVRSLEAEVPQLIESIKRNPQDGLVLAWSFFEGQPDLFHNCVWYALCQGSSISIEPPI